MLRQDTLAVPVAVVTDLGAYRDGYFLVDHRNARILLIDSAGAIRTVFGRHGGGPGEFRLPISAAAAMDGRLAILDAPFVTVVDSDAKILHRFQTRPSLGSIAWVCGDSMLAYVGYGDASAREPVRIAELFRDDGTPLFSRGTWPKWSEEINNSISLLMPTESACMLTLVEAYGTRYGFLSLQDSLGDVQQHLIPNASNPATIMTRATQLGLAPSEIGTMFWSNRRAWRLRGDTLLLRQDSTAPDRTVRHRYRLVIGDYIAKSTATDLQIWIVDKNQYVFSRQLENGDIEVGRADVSSILETLRVGLRLEAEVRE
jgi:hypothetical protein